MGFKALVLEEQDGSGTMLQQYVYGRGIDEVLQMEKVSGSVYYYHENSMGSIECLTGGSDNTVKEEYDYDDAFGSFSTPTSETGLDNPYHFQGRRHDAETGLYYFRNRNYDPETGRFLQRDPIGIWGDAANLGNGYTFGGNNHTNGSDPLGKIAVLKLIIIVVFGIIIVIGIWIVVKDASCDNKLLQ